MNIKEQKRSLLKSKIEEKILPEIHIIKKGPLGGSSEADHPIIELIVGRTIDFKYEILDEKDKIGLSTEEISTLIREISDRLILLHTGTVEVTSQRVCIDFTELSGLSKSEFVYKAQKQLERGIQQAIGDTSSRDSFFDRIYIIDQICDYCQEFQNLLCKQSEVLGLTSDEIAELVYETSLKMRLPYGFDR